jgi:TRAP-type C4-dicarboxylate transport system permease small subunit
MLAGVGILALMTLTTWNVVQRLLQGRGVAGAAELSEVALAGLAFLAIPYAVKEAQHVSTSVLTDRLAPVLARTLLVIGGFVALGVVLWGAWVAWPQAMSSMRSGEARMGLTRIALWPGRMTVAAGLTLTVAQLILSIWEVARGTREVL